jgi:uncharacterized protein (TIGR01777 family)
MPTFEYRSIMPVSAENLFAYHDRPGALERLLPPWENIKVLERTGGIPDGGKLIMEMKIGPLRKKWIALHHDYVAGRQFVDTQASGPFSAWEHTHKCVAESASTSTLIDHIEYKLPGGAAGAMLGDAFVQKQLTRMFRFRHARTHNDLLRHGTFEDRPRLRIAVTGASGVVGSHLEPFLTTGGHTVMRLVRGAAKSESEIAWNPATGSIDESKLQGVDAIIHLAGRNIAVRWNARNRKEIWESRITSTENLWRTLATMPHPPKTLICASAVGFYGSRGDEVLAETSAPGTGFSADICKAWEAATSPARQAGIRVVNLRIGPALSLKGGMLKELLTPAKLGLAGRVGNGRQFVPWIALDDLVGLIHHALMTDSIEGPLNAVAPRPARQIEFIRTLGRVIHRPTLLPLPASAVRWLFGQMGEELLLGSARVSSAAATQSGFEFLHPQLEEALRFELGRT